MEKLTILLADADDDFRVTLADTLRPLYRVRTAS